MRRLAATILVLLLASMAMAQARPAVVKGPFRLVNVRVSGSTHFAEPDIVATTGLKVGATMHPDEFKPVADKLLALGTFEEVSYEYGPAGTGIKVEFKVADTPNLLRTGFDNFVWFTDQQLLEGVRARVPLFNGLVPSDGELLPTVTDALDQFLAEKGIPGRVRFQLQQEKPGAPVHGGVFVIDGLQIKVTDVRFPGAPADIATALQTASKPLRELPFQRATCSSFAEYTLHPLMLRRGYLKAKFGDPISKLVSTDPAKPVIELTLPVEPGLQYRLGALRWTGNKAIQTFDLDKLLRVRVGQPMDAVELQANLEEVHKAYEARGYLRQYTHGIATFDDSIAVASYELRVSEGDQYRMGSLDFEGLEPRVRDRVREEWKIRAGEPYNPQYVKEFLRAAGRLLPPGAITRVEPHLDENTRTVDLILSFTFQQRAK